VRFPHPTALLAAWVAAACASAPRAATPSVPESAAPRVRSPVAVEAPAPTLEDSLADMVALDALQELEFGSLTKGAEHVRGVVPTPPVGAFRASRPRTEPRGGASSAPTYDFPVEAFADRQRVQYYKDFFLGPSRNRFTIWLGRLARYEGMIRERFRAEGIPEDMVYLGIIESGYSPTAVSRANAVGMWQFIRGTARGYGLTINTWVDERRDPFRATEAAARHLADLYAEFGSWYLAAAAYNAGAGRVNRGIRRLASDPDSVSDETFFDLSERRYLRLETRDYVPKLIAAALIAKEPLRYGFDSIPYLRPLVYDEVTVPDQTGLDVIARLADTTARAIMELNPHYMRGATPPGRSAIVRVPRGLGTEVAMRYAALPPSERVNFVEHVVRSGETLGAIGLRYRVTVELLRAANNNVHPRRLRIGRRLVIPISSAARSTAAEGRAPRPLPAVPSVRFHTVRSGDSLWAISQRYGVRISDLRRWNGIAENEVLRVGERLAVRPPS
jgi:membrane-bound lytic murein transglycosylase D